MYFGIHIKVSDSRLCDDSFSTFNLNNLIFLVDPETGMELRLKMAGIAKETTTIFGRVRDFLAVLKTPWWPSSVFCSLVGLLSLSYIPHFHSQCYIDILFQDRPSS